MDSRTRHLMLGISLVATGLAAPVAFAPSRGLVANNACAAVPGSTHYCCEEEESFCPPSGGLAKLVDFYEVPSLDSCPPTNPGGGE